MSKLWLQDPPVGETRPPMWFSNIVIISFAGFAIGVSLWVKGRFMGPAIFVFVYVAMYMYLQKQTINAMFADLPLSKSNRLRFFYNLKWSVVATALLYFVAYSSGGWALKKFFDGNNIYGILVAGAVFVATLGLICGYCKSRFFQRVQAEGYELKSIKKYTVSLNDMVAGMVVSAIFSVPLWIIHFYDYLSRQFVF